MSSHKVVVTIIGLIKLLYNIILNREILSHPWIINTLKLKTTIKHNYTITSQNTETKQDLNLSNCNII